MKKPFVLAAAALLLTATAAFAQADKPAGNAMMMKSKAPAGDTAKMQAPTDAAADADATKPKAHHRMAKNEAAMNASEAETTKQLNEQQAQMAKTATR